MSKTEMLMKRDGGVLRPYTDIDHDMFKAIDTKQPVLVTVHQARNPEHHAKFWALATAVANFSDFVDAEDAVEWAKLHIPNMHKEYTLRDGRLAIRTKSINFASMDQVKFRNFYDRALWLWSEKIGCDPETLLAQTEQAA